MRFTLCELLHMHQRQHLLHPAGDFGLGQFVLLEAKGDILLHRHMGKQRVGLEHHINRPLIRWHPRQIDAIQDNLSGGRLFKSRQHAQQG